MEFLLVSGYTNTGKTESIKELEKYLKKLGFNIVVSKYKPDPDDFIAVYEGCNQKNKKVRILLNSASDTIGIIDDFFDYYQKNQPVDIVISAIQDKDPQRSYLLRKFKLNKESFIEVPLAKILGSRKDSDDVLKQYHEQIMKLIKHILSQNPFNL